MTSSLSCSLHLISKFPIVTVNGWSEEKRTGNKWLLL